MNIFLVSCIKRSNNVHYRLPLLWMMPWLILSCCTISGCNSYFINSPRIALDTVKKNSSPKAHIIISNNTIYQNNRSGIRAGGNIPIHIQKSNIYQNGQGGINLNYSARVSITDCTISQNLNSGISADNPIQIHISGNKILQNEQGGIRIRSEKQSPPVSTSTTVKNNSIFLNKDGGIYHISDTSLPARLHISGNTIYRNQKTGIRIEDNVHMTAFNNVIYKNSTGGIAAYSNTTIPPMLDVYQNKIFFNYGSGIFIHSGITGKIGFSNNLIFNNYRGGIACGLWGEISDETIDVEIFHNTIVANGSDEEGAGIRNDSIGDVKIKNNIIAYNFTTGFMTNKCKGASNNLLFANGEVSTTKGESTSSLSFLIDKTQYSGCQTKQRGDILENPEFTNLDQYNFTLQMNSPAIGVAEPINSTYFLDVPNRNFGADLFLIPAE